MILGLSTGAFTTLHVLISIAGILTGFGVLIQMFRARVPNTLTAIFLTTTIATSVTGLFFHSKAIGPPHIVGAISLIVLAVALFALYGRHLNGRWRVAFVVCAVLALYFNVFVGVVQAFAKLAPLRTLAPTQTEPPFAIAQGATLLLFLMLGIFAVRGSRSAVGRHQLEIKPVANT